jgi:hypothetical protein
VLCAPLSAPPPPHRIEQSFLDGELNGDATGILDGGRDGASGEHFSASTSGSSQRFGGLHLLWLR